MSQNVHAVVGSGTAPEKVIVEGLRDALRPNDVVGLVWEGKPHETQEVIYDYVLDNDVEFILYYTDGQNPPKVFRENDHGVVQKVRNATVAAVKAVEGKGKVLFLWDEDADDDQIDVVADHVPAGHLILELTNGLTPIEVTVDIPEPMDPDVPADPEEEEEEDDTRFSREELETMTAVAVKRYGARVGTTAATKKGIIDELFPEGAEEPEEETVDEVDLSPENLRRTKGDPEADLEQPEEFKPSVSFYLRRIAADFQELATLLDTD